MAACEKCWADANLRVAMGGGSVADAYEDLVASRDAAGITCTPEQQCGDMHLVIGESCRCGKVSRAARPTT